jgi:hypothetical protein
MRLIKSALVGVGGIAVIAATLSAPAASADTKPQTRSAQPAATSVVSDTAETPAANNDSDCEPLGNKREDDQDCVTVRVVSEAWVKGAGEDITLRGKVHSSIQLAPGTRVIIQRATDGGAWDDKGEKWRKVATAKVREDGSFRKTVVLHRTGLHTFRAKLVTAASPRAAARPATATAQAVTARDNATPDLNVSATATATAGVAYYAYEFHNLSGHDLNIACQGFRQNPDGSIAYSPSTDYVNLKDGEPISCAYPMAPDGNGTDTIAANFTLQQADPIIGEGSIYHFNPNNNENLKACSSRQPRIAPRDVIRVDITQADWMNLGMGYTGTMNFPSDRTRPMCDFNMATSLQSSLWVGAPWWVRLLETVGVIVLLAFAAVVVDAALAVGSAVFMVAGGVGTAFIFLESEALGTDGCHSNSPSCTAAGLRYGVVKIPS